MKAAARARLTAHNSLLSIIAGHLENGQAIPCTGRNADAWTAEGDREATTYAAAQCLACPALTACTQYVTAHPEPTSVWAGLSPSERENT